jgi:NAD(P)H-dependent FMN reductase
MTALVVSSALKPGSKTLETDGFTVDLADLAAMPLPQPSDDEASLKDENVRALVQRVKRAALVVICFPISNCQPNFAAENFVKVTSEGWKDKVVSFVGSADGDCLSLASLPMASSLMVDHQCLIVPQFLQLAPASYDSTGAVVLEGTSAALFEQQMKSAVHLARTWAGPNRHAVDLKPSRPFHPRMGWSMS